MVICCGCKIYHYSFGETHSLLGYHEYHQTAVLFFKSRGGGGAALSLQIDYAVKANVVI